MNIFEEASRKKIRVKTSRGSLSVEKLWDLPLEELDNAHREVTKSLRENEEESHKSQHTY